MSSIIVVHADGVFCDTTYDIPNIEPDANVLRWYSSLYEGSREQFMISCDSQYRLAVEQWLRNLDVKFSAVIASAPDVVVDQDRLARIFKFVAAQQSKIVMFIGARFYDCNWMADNGVPSLRYIAPNRTGKGWEPDPRSSWVKAIEKQQP